MSDVSPPMWPAPEPGPVSISRWTRWQRRPGWQRWGIYVGGGLVVLTVSGAVAGDSDASEPMAATTPVTSIDVPSTTFSPTTTPAPTTTTITTTTITATTSTAPTTSAPTTTVAPATARPLSATIPGSLLALDVLATIAVENEQPDGYERDLFAYGDVVDDYGCRTRAGVLIRDSITPAQVDPAGCAVVAGDWYSPYDGQTWTDPAELEIDHVVALKEAWDSGAWGWTPERRAAFGNDLEDPRSLRAVTGSANTAKGAADPSNWIPPNPEFVCTYVADWVSVKARWGLSMDPSEFGRIRNILTERCPDQVVAPWPATAPTGPVVTSPPVVVDSSPGPPDRTCDPSYPDVCIPPPQPDLDCGDISHRRFRVVPPDPHQFDGDRDGVGCES